MSKITIPQGKIEHRAINALEFIIDKHPIMDYQFNSNDKEISWDGYIQIFKNENAPQSKENCESRIPVQIKGHYDSEEKYINKKKIYYSVDRADLELYATEKGVIYFQIFITDTKDEVFYTLLYPSKLADYIDSMRKDSTASKSIPFLRASKDPNEFYSIVKQFNNEALIQGTAQTPLVEDRILISELSKVKEMKWSVVGAKSNFDILNRLATGDICLYGKTDGDKYFRPVQTTDEFVFMLNTAVNKSVCVDNRQYYSQYQVFADSKGSINLQLSKNLSFDVVQNRFTIHFISDIYGIYTDASFLLAMNKNKVFTVADIEIKYKEFSIPEELYNRLAFFVGLYETTKMIGLKLDLPIQDYSDVQHKQLNDLVDLRYSEKRLLTTNGISKYHWMFGDKYYPLIVTNNGDENSLTSSVYSETMGVFCPSDATSSIGYRLPLFIYEDANILSNLYNYNFDVFQKQIENSEFNFESAPSLNMGVLNLINTFDICQESRFLDLANILLDRMYGCGMDDIVLLNKMQIKKRQGLFDDTDKKLIATITSSDPQALFGISVLCGNRNDADRYYALFSDKEKEAYITYPIFKLYQELKNQIE